MREIPALAVVLVALVGCGKNGAQEAKQVPATETKTDDPKLSATHEAMAESKKAPDGKPCRVEKRYSRGDLSNWWTLQYNKEGRLVQARDEQEGFRKASAKIKPRAEVDAEFAKKPFLINFEYDDKGRLVRWADNTDSDAARVITFEYGKDGRLRAYTTSEGRCTVKSDKKGNLLSESCSMKMLGGKKVKGRFDGMARRGEQSMTPPLVFANGSVWLGEAEKHLQFPGRPEALMWKVWTGRGGMLTSIDTMSLDGSKADKYAFRYDCSEAPK